MKKNNFNIIRFLGAFLVFAGHMGILMGGAAPLMGSFPLHEIGVAVLFTISGYLITKSWLSDPHPIRFAVRRFFRLWPPFAVLILLMVFVAGPLLSDLGTTAYFESDYTSYLRNLRFFTAYSLPGVFTTLPAANSVNGSLWTMPVEAFLYIVTPLLLSLIRAKSGKKASFRAMSVITVIVVAVDLYLRAFCAGVQVVVYGTDVIAAYHLITFYVVGMLFTYEETRKYLNLQAGTVGMCVLLFVQFSYGPLQYLLLYTILPYFLFSLAFVEEPRFYKFGTRFDITYGIYLYGFFFQQLAVQLVIAGKIPPNYTAAFLASAVPTLAAAFLSYVIVEKPSLKLSGWLLKKMRRQNA